MQARRLASFVIDLLLVSAPWTSFIGLFLWPAPGGSMEGIGTALILSALCGLASVVILGLHATLFVLRGKTMGMASVGLVATAGSRGLSLLYGALVLLGPASAALLVATRMGDSTMLFVAFAAPVFGVALELGFALAPSACTLSDRMAHVQWGRERTWIAWAHDGPRVAASRWPLALDGLVLGMVGAPAVFFFDGDEASSAAIAGAVTASLFLLLEGIVVARTRRTLAMRALARPASR